MEDEDGDGIDAAQVNKKLEFGNRRQSVSRVVTMNTCRAISAMHIIVDSLYSYFVVLHLL